MDPSKESGEMIGADAGSSAESRIVLVFTDIAGSVHLKQRYGVEFYTRQLSRHNEILHSALKEGGGTVYETVGDGAVLTFADAPAAVRTALEFQKRLSREAWQKEPIRVRIGIHEGPISRKKLSDGGGEKLVGLTIDVAARIQGLAMAGQILTSRPVADGARAELPFIEGVAWRAHGSYRLQGIEMEPLEIFEAGLAGISPLCPPVDSPKATRTVSENDLAALGWRPSAGVRVPGSEEWEIVRKLGEGGFGEVWLAKDTAGREWVTKFCFSMYRLRSFQVEKTLTHHLFEELGNREDLVPIHRHNLATFPFYLVSEYVANGNLVEWAKAKGGIGVIPPQVRLSLLASAARATGAAHGVGVIHKDVKPTNILIGEHDDGTPYARLIDFGIGTMSDVARLDLRNITREGLTGRVLADNISSRTFTRLYAPPEYLTGAPASVKGDIYALGVILYQLVVGDWERPLTADWRASVQDDLLAEDIARCTAENPDNRFASCEELAQSLEALPARRAARAARQERERREARNRRLTRVGIVGGVTLFLVAVASLWGIVRATNAERKANASEKKAIDALNRIEFEQYSKGLKEADRLYREGNIPEAQEVMEALPKAFQGWEFGYLDRLLRESGPVLVEKSEPKILPLDGRLFRMTEHLTVSLIYTSMHFFLETRGADGKGILGKSYSGYSRPIVLSPKGALVAARHIDDEGREAFHFISTESGDIVHRRLADDLPADKELFGDFLDEDRFVWVLSNGKSGCLDLRNEGNDKEWRIALGTNSDAHCEEITDFALYPERSLMALRIKRTKEFRQDIEIVSALDGSRVRSMESPSQYSSSPYGAMDPDYLMTQLAFSPSGESLAAAYGTRVYMWNTGNGSLTAEFGGHASRITILSFSGDGKQLASGDDTGNVWLRNTAETSSRMVFHRLPGKILNLFFWQDNRRLTICSSMEQQTYLLPTNADLQAKKTGFSDMYVHGSGFVNDPPRLGLFGSRANEHGGGDPLNILVNLSSSARQELLPVPSLHLYDVKYSSDGRWIFTQEYVDSTFQIRKYDSATANPTLNPVSSNILPPDNSGPPTWTISPDGSRVLVLYSDSSELPPVIGNLECLPASSQQINDHLNPSNATEPPKNKRDADDQLFSNRWLCYDSTTNAILGGGDSVFTGKTIDKLDSKTRKWVLHGMVYSPMKDRIALLWWTVDDGTGASSRVSLVDANSLSPVMANGVETAWLVRMPAYVRAIYLGHGEVMALFHKNLNYLDLVESTTGKSITRLRGHSGGILDAIALPDGKRLATISADRSIRIWDIATGTTIFTIPDALMVVPDGSTVAIRSSQDGTFLAWTNAGVGTGLHYGGVFKDGSESVWREPDIQPEAAAFAPDETWLATAWSDGVIRFRPMGAAPEYPTFESVESSAPKTAAVPQKPIECGKTADIAISPCGSFILAVSPDGQASLWNLATGERLWISSLAMEYWRGKHDIAFSSDLKWIAVARELDGKCGVSLLDRESGEIRWTHAEAGRFPLSRIEFSPGDTELLLVNTTRDGVRVFQGLEREKGKPIFSFRKKLGLDNLSQILAGADEEWEAALASVAELPGKAKRSQPDKYALTVSLVNTALKGVLYRDGRGVLIAIPPAAGIVSPPDGRLLYALGGHYLPIERYILSPKSTWAATTSADGSVRIWNLAGIGDAETAFTPSPAP